MPRRHVRRSTRSRRCQPDLVFLDVQMPGATGFDVIDAVGAGRMPFVVFVTAYDRYALRAFDVHALDYLLKPFDRERFHQALARARAAARAPVGRRARAPPARARAGSEADAAARSNASSSSPAAASSSSAPSEIDWIEAAGNYVKLHVGTDAHLFRETMNAIEAQLRSRHVLPHPPLATSSTSSACASCSRGSTASTSCS